MSTRAVYTFIDDRGSYPVYKHHNGYPEGAWRGLENALLLAWPLPRFEADEFAASFVAATKISQGGVRLTTGPEAHGDLEYRYEIRSAGAELRVTVFRVMLSDWEAKIFTGTLAEMKARYPLPVRAGA